MSVKQALVNIAEYRCRETHKPVQDQYAFERGVYYFLQGCAAVCFYVTEPEKSIGTVIGRGDWVGANSVGAKYSVVSSVEVIEDTKILFFSERKLLALAENEPQVYKVLFNASRDLHKIWLQSFLSFAHHNILQVCYILLDIYTRTSKKNRQSRDITITQQQLSAVVGCTRPKLNALLKDLERRGYIELGRNKITLINVDLLKAQVSRMNLMARNPTVEHKMGVV
ncbi:Crp/Fnr family transcriptional regulator [Vibrio agarivorans]|uniref:Crp/Fnr family transcriptional regulator n=1 Tax=Vibrio agarivorans TaxID=153622 RepID=A0ABT7XZK1_9VIBR|nr:Crp/Fnr family transcriptional regulator [Vibrio agarivorans]MDN2481200.1 Crp/Fnr family transcriptional regulator [Vibrio agarivorans]